MNLKRKNKVSPDFSLASMTDIVFLLLIFFMLTSTATNPSALDVKLPKADGAEAQTEIVSVSISPEGKYYINDTEVDSINLEANLQEKFVNVPDPAFIINADENAKHKDVVYVMSLANKNKYKIVIATEPNEK
ncbi:MAG: biopolymer transporter ExbD [Chryseobacterium sp.]|nr:MAG: biopolymer transporter ExbD [Chryseobacterium sp.]